jgi:hypothetical protein
MSSVFIDYDGLGKFLEKAVCQYERSAPAVAGYLDDLYQRIEESAMVDLREIKFTQTLLEGGIWTHPNQAANGLLHLLDRLGRSTVGLAGF